MHSNITNFIIRRFSFTNQICGHHAIALLCINFSSMPYFCRAVIIYTCTTMGVDKSNLLLILNRLSIINTQNTNYWTYFTLLHTKWLLKYRLFHMLFPYNNVKESDKIFVNHFLCWHLTMLWRRHVLASFIQHVRL